MLYVRPLANEECCAGANEWLMVCAERAPRRVLAERNLRLQPELSTGRFGASRGSRKQRFVGCEENTVFLED
jgi:predicted TIM-barrel fold metal-dependent hydrolase